MSRRFPDMTGYELEVARRRLEAVGAEIEDVIRVGPNEAECEGGRTFVIRQRETTAGRVELVVAGEWRSPAARIR